MAWRAELSPRALKQLSKLDKPTARRIIDYLRETASGEDPRSRGKGRHVNSSWPDSTEDPRSRGKGLTGNLAGFWRYRVGNYRIIASIEDDELLILAINIDHRSRIYR